MNNTVVVCQSIVGSLDDIKNLPAFPVSVMTAACNLPSEGFKVKFIDQRRNPYWKLELDVALNDKPIMVCVTAMLGEQILHSLEILKYVKEHSDVATVWGGSQGSIMPEITIQNPYIDYLIQGDGEESLPLLAKAIVNGTPISEVPGIWSRRSGQGKLPVQVDLNKQHEPLYDSFGEDIHKYLPDRFGYPSFDMELSRGCPFRCAMCYQPFMNHSVWRALDLEKVKERILRLNKSYGIESFWFIDDEFFIDLSRSKAIVEFMYENNFKWSIQGVTIRSVIKMDKDYLNLLKKAGCKQLNIGAESGSEKILKMIHKPIKIEEVLKVNQNLKEVGIIPSYYFIVGFPDEDKNDFRETLSLVSRLLKENSNAKIMNIGCYSPYPNSELEKRCIELGYKPPEKLEDYANFGVDRENLPWQIGNKDIIGANFANYFLDKKVDDLTIPKYIKTACKIYQPIARWRFNHQYFGLPIDIQLGNYLKNKLMP